MGKAGIGEGVHHAAHQGGQAIGANGTHDVIAADALFYNLAGGKDVTGGLHHGDNHDDDERENRYQVKLRHTEVERGSNAEGGGGGDLLKGGVAKHKRYARTQD